MKEAVVRYYVDADILGLATVLAGLNAEVTYPGDPGAVVKKVYRPKCIIDSPAVRTPCGSRRWRRKGGSP